MKTGKAGGDEEDPRPEIRHRDAKLREVSLSGVAPSERLCHMLERSLK
jgi:hypothetical protein